MKEIIFPHINTWGDIMEYFTQRGSSTYNYYIQRLREIFPHIKDATMVCYAWKIKTMPYQDNYYFLMRACDVLHEEGLPRECFCGFVTLNVEHYLNKKSDIVLDMGDPYCKAKEAIDRYNRR